MIIKLRMFLYIYEKFKWTKKYIKWTSKKISKINIYSSFLIYLHFYFISLVFVKLKFAVAL